MHATNHPEIMDDMHSTPQLTDNTLANAPTLPVDNTMTDVFHQSGNDPGCMTKEIGTTDTHISDLENEFSNFHLENVTNDIQADLDNVQQAQVLMNEILMSKMDAIDNKIMSRVDDMNKELSSQMSELKNLIQNNMLKPSLVPGHTERDQVITEELLFNHKMERMHDSAPYSHGQRESPRNRKSSLLASASISPVSTSCIHVKSGSYCAHYNNSK